ncbi:MAG TPA: PIG-L family deacetylase, partial [Labilithrix sp.]
MRRILGLVVLLSACGGDPAPTAKLAHKPNDAFDVYGQMASAAAEAPCSSPPAAGPIPNAPKRADADFGVDVLFVYAHPEDETLFSPGTMATLVKKKKRLFEEVMTHGEGGRLLEKDASGGVSERTGVPPLEVAKVRDKEFQRVMHVLGIPYEHMYPASAGGDFVAKDVEGHERAVHACGETLEKWDQTLPGGVAGLLRKLVVAIRNQRPRVIVTHDARDDEDWLDHGHHKALGMLVEMAARAAADPRAPGGEPWVVEEVVTVAPKQVETKLAFDVGIDMRKKLMFENASQFEPQKYAEVAQRSVERFVVRWDAKGVSGPVFGAMMAP